MGFSAERTENENGESRRSLRLIIDNDDIPASGTMVDSQDALLSGQDEVLADCNHFTFWVDGEEALAKWVLAWDCGRSALSLVSTFSLIDIDSDDCGRIRSHRMYC